MRLVTEQVPVERAVVRLRLLLWAWAMWWFVLGILLGWAVA